MQLIIERKCKYFQSKSYDSNLKNISISVSPQICKDRNQRIISITKIVIPYSFRDAVKAGRLIEIFSSQ